MQMVLNTSNFSLNESAAIITRPVTAEAAPLSKGEQAKQHRWRDQTNQSQHAEVQKHGAGTQLNSNLTSTVQLRKLAALLSNDAHIEKVETGGAFSNVTNLVIQAVVVFLVIAFLLLMWQNNCSLWRTVSEVKEHPRDLVDQFSDGKAKQAAGQIGYDLTHPGQQRRQPATCC